MHTICFATHNAHKLAEVSRQLEGYYHIIGLDSFQCPDIPETGDTLAENSALKARYVWENYQIPCFADDSGLETDALHGAPGVHSARFAGPQRSDTDNLSLLLSRLRHEQNRKARFKTCISYIDQQGEMYQFEGVVEGSIVEVPKGSNGFGYDPVFQPEGEERTFAEMKPEEKIKISHRAIAIAQLVTFLRKVD
jgi:XTP/dITP diphosphohydrolase